MTSLIHPDIKSRVSSVLNKDTKQFGRQFMFDGLDETCWNSHPSSPQWIIVDFEREVAVDKIVITFQGGFAAKEMKVMREEGEGEWKEVEEFYPEDKNHSQTFALKEACKLSKLRLFFPSSTDFFGRITIYKLDVIGQ